MKGSNAQSPQDTHKGPAETSSLLTPNRPGTMVNPMFSHNEARISRFNIGPVKSQPSISRPRDSSVFPSGFFFLPQQWDIVTEGSVTGFRVKSSPSHPPWTAVIDRPLWSIFSR